VQIYLVVELFEVGFAHDVEFERQSADGLVEERTEQAGVEQVCGS